MRGFYTRNEIGTVLSLTPIFPAFVGVTIKESYQN